MLEVGQSDTLASGHSRSWSVLLLSGRRTVGCREAMVVVVVVGERDRGVAKQGWMCVGWYGRGGWR
jgi:hypothetical protein